MSCYQPAIVIFPHLAHDLLQVLIRTALPITTTILPWISLSGRDVQVEAAATLEPIRARLEFGPEVISQPFCRGTMQPIRARLEIACRGRPTLNPNPNP